MIVFGLPHYERLAATIADEAQLQQGQCRVDRFANRELHATIETAVGGEDCVLVGSVAPPDEDLLSFLLVAHSLRKEGARSIVAVLPYLGYARQDHPEPGRSLAAAWVGVLLQGCGVTEVVTVDVHSPRAHDLVPVPLHSLSPAPILATTIRAFAKPDVTIVAPDEGARERCEAVRQAAGITRPVAYFLKKRTAEGVTHSALHGSAGGLAVVVDDILDTGGTLVSACEALRAAGVREILVMVTHGLFTGTRWQKLWSLGVTTIYCLDTVALPTTDTRILGLGVAPLLAGWVGDRALAATT